MTIVTLTGDNGLLQKATTAKQANEEASVLEMIKTEVAGSYNLEGKIDLSELKRNLKHLNILDEDIKPTIKDEKETFPVIAKITNYEYDILENGNVYEHIDFETLESSYGKVVNNYIGYEATDVTEWKLLYVDEENREAFIVSSNALSAPQPTENGIPLISKSGIAYTGSNSVANFQYGINYNSLWLEKCITENQNGNAKATAYMCDPDNWNQYKTGKAKYAAGGPTFEIMIASSYKQQVKNLKNIDYLESIKNITSSGYHVMDREGGVLYVSGGTYWFASPRDVNDIMECMYGNGTSGFFYYTNFIPLRPVVCLPASAIEVVGEGDNAVLNYK